VKKWALPSRPTPLFSTLLASACLQKGSILFMTSGVIVAERRNVGDDPDTSPGVANQSRLGEDWLIEVMHYGYVGKKRVP